MQFKLFKHKPTPLVATSDVPKEITKINWAALLSLCTIMFCLGIGWYIPGGIASPLESAFPGTTQANVNLTLTLYLIGAIISAVFIPLLFFKIRRKWIIFYCAVIYCIASVIVAFSSNFSELLFFRFLCGLAHGGISAIITVVAMAIAPKNKHGTAVTATLVSLFAATCTIVPIFTFVSNMDVGHNLPALATLAMGKQNWRWTFFATAVVVLIGGFCVYIFVPKDLHLTGGKPNIKSEIKSIVYWPFTLTIVFALVVFLAIFIIYPLLQEEWTSPIVGIIANKQNLLGLLLAMYGICSAGGNILGGIFTNGKSFPWLYMLVAGTLIGLIGLAISVACKNAAAILAFTLIFPVFAYTLLPNIYAIGLPLGKYHDKSDNVDFESGLVQCFVGFGAMIGTAIGGPICTNHTATLAGTFNPDNFGTVVYIALAFMIVGAIILIPINWYMYNAKLTMQNKKTKFDFFAFFPIIIDKYAPSELRNEIYANPKLAAKKIIDTTKFHSINNKQKVDA